MNEAFYGNHAVVRHSGRLFVVTWTHPIFLVTEELYRGNDKKKARELFEKAEAVWQR